MIITDLQNEQNISNKTFACPEYSPQLYAIIANQYIGKEVILPASRQKSSSKYFIDYIHKIPRSIQQRLAVGNAKSWENIVYLYNQFSDELGYEKITHQRQLKKSTKVKALRMCDTKDHSESCPYVFEDMVYMSDGMYIHKNDCWW